LKKPAVDRRGGRDIVTREKAPTSQGGGLAGKKTNSKGIARSPPIWEYRADDSGNKQNFEDEKKIA